MAHGIHSSIAGQKVVIGSYHFVFEDESCVIREEFRNGLNIFPKNILIFISRLRMNWLL